MRCYSKSMDDVCSFLFGFGLDLIVQNAIDKPHVEHKITRNEFTTNQHVHSIILKIKKNH